MCKSISLTHSHHIQPKSQHSCPITKIKCYALGHFIDREIQFLLMTYSCCSLFHTQQLLLPLISHPLRSSHPSLRLAWCFILPRLVAFACEFLCLAATRLPLASLDPSRILVIANMLLTCAPKHYHCVNTFVIVVLDKPTVSKVALETLSCDVRHGSTRNCVSGHKRRSFACSISQRFSRPSVEYTLYPHVQQSTLVAQTQHRFASTYSHQCPS